MINNLAVVIGERDYRPRPRIIVYCTRSLKTKNRAHVSDFRLPRSHRKHRYRFIYSLLREEFFSFNGNYKFRRDFFKNPENLSGKKSVI